MPQALPSSCMVGTVSRRYPWLRTGPLRDPPFLCIRGGKHPSCHPGDGFLGLLHTDYNWRTVFYVCEKHLTPQKTYYPSVILWYCNILDTQCQGFSQYFCALAHILCASFFTQFLVFLFTVNNGCFSRVSGIGTVLKHGIFFHFCLQLFLFSCIEYPYFTKILQIKQKK